MTTNSVLTEKNCDIPKNLIDHAIIDGIHAERLHRSMVSPEMSEDTVNSIFSNAYGALRYLARPNYLEHNLSKVLCLGKVQSGKTAFFIAVSALAFDNGYRIIYLLGGTKTTLKNQNLKRVSKEFFEDKDVVVYDVNQVTEQVIQDDLSRSKLIVLVVLKNTAKITNLGRMKEIASHFNMIPSVVIDDEGDEVTPGAPKTKKKTAKAGVTHDDIVNNLHSLDCCTYFSVTATPQANFLLSTIDDISPDYCVLVHPGKGYTGGNSFHDVRDNPHCIEIEDSDDFYASIPDSFKQSLYFFIFACCLKDSENHNKHYSMLVHPSSFTAIQDAVSDKINTYILKIMLNLSDRQNVAYNDEIEEIHLQYEKYIIEHTECPYSFEDIIQNLTDVLAEIKLYQLNSRYGKECMAELESYENDPTLKSPKYKIYIGGNMLGRGLTLENLIVTYMYRDSKVTAIDTLYQRARWFGYKSKYFDVCRVYMTKNLKDKFIAIVENENEMWNTLSTFLNDHLEIKYFPRLFVLNSEKLMLTRKSISKTEIVDKVKQGFTAEESVLFENGKSDINNNRNLYEDCMNKWIHLGREEKFAKNENQNHFLIDMKYSEFYDEFLSKYKYQINSKLGKRTFERIMEKVSTGEAENKILVIIMRYNIREHRSLTDNGMAVKRLLQSYDNPNEYSGDRYLSNKNIDTRAFLSMQIHLVYTDRNNKNDFMPLLVLNNPIDTFDIQLVTGDNYYEKL